MATTAILAVGWAAAIESDASWARPDAGGLRYVRRMLLWRFPVLWRWRARRAIRPMVAEQQAAMEQLGRGPDDWLRWWRATGERELQCILMTAWDPIGVNDAPEAWDEYDDYVPGVADRLRDARDFDDAATGVADYLNHV